MRGDLFLLADQVAGREQGLADLVEPAGLHPVDDCRLDGPTGNADREPDDQRGGHHRSAGTERRETSPWLEAGPHLLNALARLPQHFESSVQGGEGTPTHPPKGGCVATTLRMVGVPTEDLPIDECRRLVAMRTGVIGYPDAHAIGVAHCSR